MKSSSTYKGFVTHSGAVKYLFTLVPGIPKINVSISQLIIFSSIYLTLVANKAFFSNTFSVYPINLDNAHYLISLAILFTSLNIILLSLSCFKYTVKPVLITILLLSSGAAYFMDAYNVIIDDSMIDNVMKTDFAESLDLFSLKMIIYILLVGIIPSLFVYKSNIVHSTYNKSVFSRLKLLSLALIIFFGLIAISGNFYASFFREHKPLRFYANPSYYLYSTGKYLSGFFTSELTDLKPIGLDAKKIATDEKRDLIIFVVGEAARADHYSLNGYIRKTNPYLEQTSVISFENVWSCGTSTAHSVPCIFSIYNRAEFSKSKAENTENILDVLQRAGVNVLWLDNNSSSKGVADRVPYESYKSTDKNPLCDSECRDAGMLENLQDYIKSHPVGDIFIVLHQMGNHGPAYYKRYPQPFEKFTPVCKTNQLEQCQVDEIINAYDNALLYTDYFLSKTIALLKESAADFNSAMFYVSDHGESLGENGMYLHGLPYPLAPDYQKHVPLFMWFSENYKDETIVKSMQSIKHIEFSHDNIFHTILGLLDIDTTIYVRSLDIRTHANQSTRKIFLNSKI